MSKTKEAMDFLFKWQPKGPWNLAAINPNGGKFESDTFGPGRVEACAAWIAARNGKRNLYYTPNDVRPGFRGKAAKKNIVRVRTYHADIDPFVPKDGDVDFDEERKRIKRLIEAFPIKPTATIFSGGGYQLFWKMKQRKPLVNGTLEETETINLKLARWLGGDSSCQDVSHIMRLPGTMNIPNAKKKRLGREPAMAKLVQANWKRLYEEKDFESLYEFDEHVAKWLGPLIVAGERSDDPDRYDGDRSSAGLAAVGELKRCGLELEDIQEIVLNEDFAISEHYVEQKNPERAVQRAYDKVEDVKLHQDKDEDIEAQIASLNEQFVQIVEGGTHVILCDKPVIDQPFEMLKPDSFRALYRGQNVRIGKKDVAITDLWLEHPERRQARGLVFKPNAETPGLYNIWQGWKLEPKAGDWSLFDEHLFTNVCQEDPDRYGYFLDWWAHKLQFPERKIGTTLVVRGGEGVGKSNVGEVFKYIMSPYWLKVSSQEQVTGRFNSHHTGIVLLHSEEAFYAGDPRVAGKLKDLITSDTQLIEFKGQEPRSMPCYYDLLLTGNPDWMVPASMEARRFAVYDVGTKHMQDSKYFEAIRMQMWETEQKGHNNGRGCRALMHFLLNRKITRDLRNVPKTEGLMRQKELSFHTDMDMLMEFAQHGEIDGCMPKEPNTIRTDILFAAYLDRCQEVNQRYRMSRNQFGRFLKGMEINKRQKADGKRYYIFPELGEFRELFEKKVNQKIKWENKRTEWTNSDD